VRGKGGRGKSSRKNGNVGPQLMSIGYHQEKGDESLQKKDKVDVGRGPAWRLVTGSMTNRTGDGRNQGDWVEMERVVIFSSSLLDNIPGEAKLKNGGGKKELRGNVY